MSGSAARPEGCHEVPPQEARLANCGLTKPALPTSCAHRSPRRCLLIERAAKEAEPEACPLKGARAQAWLRLAVAPQPLVEL